MGGDLIALTGSRDAMRTLQRAMIRAAHGHDDEIGEGEAVETTVDGWLRWGAARIDMALTEADPRGPESLEDRLAAEGLTEADVTREDDRLAAEQEARDGD